MNPCTANTFNPNTAHFNYSHSNRTLVLMKCWTSCAPCTDVWKKLWGALMPDWMPWLQQTGETFVTYASLQQAISKGLFSSGVISKRLHSYITSTITCHARLQGRRTSGSLVFPCNAPSALLNPIFSAQSTWRISAGFVREKAPPDWLFVAVNERRTWIWR